MRRACWRLAPLGLACWAVAIAIPGPGNEVIGVRPRPFLLEHHATPPPAGGAQVLDPVALDAAAGVGAERAGDPAGGPDSSAPVLMRVAHAIGETIAVIRRSRHIKVPTGIRSLDGHFEVSLGDRRVALFVKRSF